MKIVKWGNMALKFLVCDDDADLLYTLNFVLVDAFPTATIVPCKNGIEAMERIRRGEKFHCIITDYNMKCIGGSGLDLFYFKENMKECDALFILTSADDKREFYELQALGKIIFIPKENLSQDLVKTVRGKLEESEKSFAS